MNEKNSENRSTKEWAAGIVPDRVPYFTDDIVNGSAPAFALGSMMISASQSHSRAMEATVMALANNYVVGLATTTQCVNRILGAPSEAQQVFMAALQARQLT